MPWTVDDVDSHKKGLSDKQKKQWVRIANTVLKKLLAKGIKEEEAAPSAIKQANGVVNINTSKEQYSSYAAKILTYEAKLVEHQEKAHMVVPAVMMVEGVHSGSQGPLFHSIEELGKFPESWNGRPVVIYHPEEDGIPVSANSPDIIDNRAVGKIYNTSVDGKKLKAEVWFDEDKLNAISPETLVNINEGKEMELSLGMFTENDYEDGEYEGAQYIGIAHNHRPDHLAILPDQIGACSCDKGCGLGANSKKELPFEHKSVYSQIMRAAGYSINQIGDSTKPDYQKRINMINDTLRSLDEHVYHYLEELYEDYLIYGKSENNSFKIYKQSYKLESGKIEFVGEPVEVHKKVEYIVNSGIDTNKFSINQIKEDKNMPNGKDCPTCKAKVDALIANEKTPWKEADREYLLTQEESILDKLAPVEVEKVVEKTVEVNKLTPEQTADLAFVANMRKEKKAKMVNDILSNTEKGVWDEPTLTAMSEDVLEKVHKSVKKVEAEVTDYSIIPGFVAQGKSASGGPLYMPGVEIETTK